jgi:hypothetical protein
MKKETIDQLYKEFEQYALEVNGVECWSARELQELLGYSKWENFTKVINKAHISEANTLPIDVYANNHKKAPIEVTLLFIVKS